MNAKTLHFEETIYFNREKEDNWGIEAKATELGFKNPEKLVYLGYEIEVRVRIDSDGKNKVLCINNIDVSDKDIYI